MRPTSCRSAPPSFYSRPALATRAGEKYDESSKTPLRRSGLETEPSTMVSKIPAKSLTDFPDHGHEQLADNRRGDHIPIRPLVMAGSVGLILLTVPRP
jgi:hypothetical protein